MVLLAGAVAGIVVIECTRQVFCVLLSLSLSLSLSRSLNSASSARALTAIRRGSVVTNTLVYIFTRTHCAQFLAPRRLHSRGLDPGVTSRETVSESVTCQQQP